MVKMRANRPILVGRDVMSEGMVFTTNEQHARELVVKGYAAMLPHEEVVVTTDAEKTTDIAATSRKGRK